MDIEIHAAGGDDFEMGEADAERKLLITIQVVDEFEMGYVSFGTFDFVIVGL